MGIIRILDEHIANQIVAGEVVERPASVVKELVENAIDAGSTKIDVTVEEGGLDSIRVTDNGAGIDPEDCETAFTAMRQAKSLKAAICFKSPALDSGRSPAIHRGRIQGASGYVQCSGWPRTGDRNRRRSSARERRNGRTRGTDFLVKELFFNTPARLKYMKTIQTELGHISDYMYRLALSRPDIAFTLRHNGNSLRRRWATAMPFRSLRPYTVPNRPKRCRRLKRRIWTTR